MKKLREVIPPVAARNDIDLVVSGHDHIYNRTFLMDSEGKKVEGSDADFEQEKEEGQTLYLTLASSSGSKFYDYVPGLDWEAKSVHNDTPAFTRMRVSDEALRATTYEVPAGGVQQPETQAASEKIDDVEISRSDDDGRDPGADAGVGGDDAETSSDAASAEADDTAEEGIADGTEADSGADSTEADGPTAGAEAGAQADADSGAAAGPGTTSAKAGSDAGVGDLPRTGSDCSDCAAAV